MSVPLKAKRDFPYAGHRIRKGQDFDARGQSDALLLKAIGHAEDRPAAAPVAAPAPQTYSTRMMTAATPAPVFATPPPIVTAGDDLDGMDAEALHELADQLGVYVHHRTGAERVRQAIREHRKSGGGS